ncbi:MAG: hypothetical protein U0703_09835 [Anaerolineae bacterium]
MTLPHANVVLPYHNFDNLEYQFISTYRKRFTLPEPLNGRRLYVDFDGAMIAATVSINGHSFDEHDGGYVPFSFDLTDYLRDGERPAGEVDSTERPDIPPYGYIVDYLTFGGLPRRAPALRRAGAYRRRVRAHQRRADGSHPKSRSMFTSGIRSGRAVQRLLCGAALGS